jgi:hypothetical protein
MALLAKLARLRARHNDTDILQFCLFFLLIALDGQQEMFDRQECASDIDRVDSVPKLGLDLPYWRMRALIRYTSVRDEDTGGAEGLVGRLECGSDGSFRRQVSLDTMQSALLLRGGCEDGTVNCSTVESGDEAAMACEGDVSECCLRFTKAGTVRCSRTQEFLHSCTSNPTCIAVSGPV